MSFSVCTSIRTANDYGQSQGMPLSQRLFGVSTLRGACSSSSSSALIVEHNKDEGRDDDASPDYYVVWVCVARCREHTGTRVNQDKLPSVSYSRSANVVDLIRHLIRLFPQPTRLRTPTATHHVFTNC